MKIVKMIALIVFLLAANVLFGLTLNRAESRFDAMFTLDLDLLVLALWVFGSMLLVAFAAGIAAALVRPFWATALAFFLSALAVLPFWGLDWIPAAFVLVYFLLALVYANNVRNEMEQRIRFSAAPVQREQKALLSALALLVSVAFALGYQRDAAQKGYVLPPAFKQVMVDAIVPAPGSEAGDLLGQFGPAAEQQMRQEAERIWAGMEEQLRPFAAYLPIALALLVFGILEFLLNLVSWIPLVLLAGIFPLFTALGITRTETETKEVARLVL
ncbi:MAG: hypothetical protein FD146_2553 [Anaerolineaceae bacterium]|nr:MAG: hypothetical protein FD146_2553 [Anaerolineaceae bacterium]